AAGSNQDAAGLAGMSRPAFSVAQKQRKAAAFAGSPAMTAPTELRVSKDRRLLSVTFPGHQPLEIPAELLRVLSPSAEVQGHSPSQRVTVPGKRNVSITRIEPVGNYAVRITFDDRHDTGIFSWDYLHTLGHE